MSYGYSTPYDHYSPIEYAQPHPEPYPDHFVHPNSAAAQLGLTSEEIREVLEDQERWFREEYQQEPEEDRARTSTEHQEQEQHQDEARWVPTPPIGDSEPTPQAYETSYDGSDDDTSPYDDGPLDPELAPRLLHQPPTPIPDAQSPPPPLECDAHGTANTDDDDAYVALFEHDGFNGNPALAEPDCDAIEPLVHELVVSDDVIGSWAEEMEMGLELQGEYSPANYFPNPSPPSPAPLHQPPPSITIYIPPRINYAPPPAHHRPHAPTTRPDAPHSAPTPAPSARGAPLAKTKPVT
jgi:hypothetical protein